LAERTRNEREIYAKSLNKICLNATIPDVHFCAGIGRTILRNGSHPYAKYFYGQTGIEYWCFWKDHELLEPES